jgi:hypothetical protein
MRLFSLRRCQNWDGPRRRRGADMADQLSGCEADKVLDAPLGTIFGCLFGLVPGGPVRTLLIVLICLCVVLFPFIYRYYLGVLAQGAAPEGSLERQDYDKLRAGLAGGNLAARLYSKWLSKFLDWIERFFGDAGMADRTLFPRAFGLKTPAPLWTAPAFDRCLLLALVYPIATIFVIWAVSGHAGPVETVIGLQPNVPGWSRGLAAAAIGFLSFTFWGCLRAGGRESPVLIAVAIAGTGAGAGTFAVGIFVPGAGAGAVAVTIAFTVAGAVAFAVAFAGAGAGAFAAAGMFAVAFTLAIAGSGAGAGAFAIACAVAVAVAALSALPIKHRLQGVFLSLFLPTMVLACFAAAAFLSHLDAWSIAGRVLLFFGLFTLMNAPLTGHPSA